MGVRISACRPDIRVPHGRISGSGYAYVTWLGFQGVDSVCLRFSLCMQRESLKSENPSLKSNGQALGHNLKP